MKRRLFLAMGMVAFGLSFPVTVQAGEWKQEGTAWYYEQDGNRLNNGWNEIDGKWYYFKDSGVMAANEIIEGYRLAADGSWVEETKKVYEHEGDTPEEIIANYLTLDTKYAITLEELKNKNRDAYTAGTGSVYGPSLSQRELDEVAQKVHHIVTNYITNDMTQIQRVDMLYAYMINTCYVVPTWEKNQANTAWGSLVYGEAQCSGFARGFKALCDAIDIPCYYVHANEASANPSHQWNMIQVDGKWYHMDVQAGYFLLSDQVYANTGMEWNRSEFPACPESYFPQYDEMMWAFPYLPSADWIKE